MVTRILHLDMINRSYAGDIQVNIPGWQPCIWIWNSAEVSGLEKVQEMHRKGSRSSRGHCLRDSGNKKMKGRRVGGE